MNRRWFKVLEPKANNAKLNLTEVWENLAFC